jgi:hypothetical protein
MASAMQVERREESSVARNTAEAEEAPRVGEVEGAKLDPIGSVKRLLTRPDGSKVVVEVPVYPPFRLSDRPSIRKPPVRSRSAPSLKRKRTSSARREGPRDD